MEKIYWDIKEVLSYNRLLNFIVGPRGVGKTYGTKCWAIDDFIKSKKQFAYVRRYKEELGNIKKYFDDVREVYPNIIFEVKGYTFYINGKIAGYAFPLSIANSYKSTSFPEINKIIFDEFILDKGFQHYLPDDVGSFLDLYETISRGRDIPAFLLSNAVTITNPYFNYFKIDIPYNNNIIKMPDILVQYVESDNFTKMRKETRFGRIINDTQYGKYAMENNFLRDSDTFIEQKTPKAKYFFTMRFKGHTLGVWSDTNEGRMYVTKKFVENFPIDYALTAADHSPNTLLLNVISKHSYYATFIKNYSLGNVRFSDIDTKNICTNILKMRL